MFPARLTERTDDRGLGIRGLAAVHRFCSDLDVTVRFHQEVLGFDVVGRSGPDLIARSGQRSVLLRAGGCLLVCSQPVGEGAAQRFLRLHPEGIGELIVDVEEAERAFRVLDGSGGTPVSGIERFAPGDFPEFVIATPMDDVQIRFVQRDGHPSPLSGLHLDAPAEIARDGTGLIAFDHITANFRTIAPALLWFQHVLGLEKIWEISFHTQSEATEHLGSGLRSVVMGNRAGLTFACNEPLRPRFTSSQISRFCDDQRGSGIQHVALLLDDLQGRLPALRQRGAIFTPPPLGYHDRIDSRLTLLGSPDLSVNPDGLRDAGILIDGHGDGRHLLQIFLGSGTASGSSAPSSPFFYELIQREGDDGFGAGNFRALFEGLEKTIDRPT